MLKQTRFHWRKLVIRHAGFAQSDLSWQRHKAQGNSRDDANDALIDTLLLSFPRQKLCSKSCTR